MTTTPTPSNPTTQLTRRNLLATSAASAAATLFTKPAWADLSPSEKRIPFTNDKQPQDHPTNVVWQKLQKWHTPSNQLYVVSHYELPEPLEPKDWSLEITGHIKNPTTLSYFQLLKLPQKTVTATLECGGNGVSPGFMGAIGNMKWTGTPLLPLLKKAGLSEGALEAACFGADSGEEEFRKKKYPQFFSRSLPLSQSVMKNALLCHSMNGQPLTHEHGAPVRLVVPGWYGVSWVKWLNRIDITDRRHLSRFMSQDYVTIRGEVRPNGQTVWRRSLVTAMNVKSVTASVIQQSKTNYLIQGAAWSDGSPLTSVQIKIDDGPWQPATLDKKPDASQHTWTFWRLPWLNPTPGKHTIVSRATDANGRVQPAKTDPAIKLKKTYWEANQQVIREIEIT